MAYDLDMDAQGQGQEGALAALLEVIEDESSIRRYYEVARSSFEREDYEMIISLAWRYQFDVDRTKFKRSINELLTHVSPRIQARLELTGE